MASILILISFYTHINIKKRSLKEAIEIQNAFIDNL